LKVGILDVAGKVEGYLW